MATAIYSCEGLRDRAIAEQFDPVLTDEAIGSMLADGIGFPLPDGWEGDPWDAPRFSYEHLAILRGRIAEAERADRQLVPGVDLDWDDVLPDHNLDYLDHLGWEATKVWTSPVPVVDGPAWTAWLYVVGDGWAWAMTSGTGLVVGSGVAGTLNQALDRLAELVAAHVPADWEGPDA